MASVARNHTGHRVGEAHPKAKLTDAQVNEMRLLRRRGWKYAALALEFNCGESTVRDIVTYRTRWAILTKQKQGADNETNTKRKASR